MKKEQAIEKIKNNLDNKVEIKLYQYKNDYIAICGGGMQPILIGDNVFRGLNQNYAPDKKYFDYLYKGELGNERYTY